MKRLFFCAITYLLLPSATLAGWQNTEWGMTKDEVTERVPNLIVAQSSPTLQMTTKVRLSGIVFDATLEFEPRAGLSSVLLSTTGDDCHAARGKFALAYGPAEPVGIEGLSRWREIGSDNLVDFSLFSDQCYIRYQPIPEKNAIGLL